MGIGKFNTSFDTIDWGINVEALGKSKKLRELELGRVYKLTGLSITKDRGYGKGCILFSDTFKVGIPARYIDTVEGILADPETVEDIKNGKCGFKYTTFKSDKYNRDGFDVEFVEL